MGTDPIIDDDEILPEIEIREMMTLEQMQEYNNNFIAFTDNDICILLSDLSNENFQGFIEQYKTIINKKELYINDLNTIPIINAIRKDYDEDNEEIQKYFQDYEDALTARNYTLQQIRINKISFPFQILEENVNFRLSYPGEVLLDYIKPDLTKITVFDIEHFNDITIKSLVYKAPLWTSESYFNEYNKKYQLNFDKKILISDLVENNQLKDIYKIIKDELIPKFSDVLKSITHRLDLHELKLILSYNSYDLDTITKEQFSELNEYLTSIITDEKETETEENNHDIVQFKIKKKYDKFYEILLHHFSKFSIITEPDKMILILDRLTNYIANIPPAAIVLGEELSNSKILDLPLDEVIIKVKTYFNEQNKAKVIKFMNDYKLLSVPEDLEEIINKYELIDAEYLDSCKFLSMNVVNDLSTVVLGNDTSNYDGNPYSDNVNLKSEHLSEEYIELENEDDEHVEIVEDAINIYELNDAFNQEELEELSDGVKDILLYVMPILLKIHKISALPINTKVIAKRLSKIIIFESRSSQIRKHLPDISDNLVKMICQDNFEDSLNAIQDISNVSMITTLQDIYPSIHKSWEKECDKIIIDALTLWWLELLESSLRGNLIFNIFDGYIEYANKWSRYGAPLEDKPKTGIILYLCFVATNLPERNINLNEIELEKEILKCAQNKYEEKIILFKKLWEDVSKTVDTLSNVENIKMSLIEIIKLVKLGKKSKKMLPTYVDAFLNLPRLIDQKHVKTAFWAQGCCITNLNEDYEADTDWRSFGSLWSLKNILSQSRFIKKREKYFYFPKEAAETEEKVEYINPKCNEIPVTEEEEKEELKYTWLPSSVLNDDKYAKTLTSDIIKNIYSIKNANFLLKIFDNINSILECKSILLLISKVLFKFNNPIINENNYCNEIKEYLGLLKEKDLTIAKYVIARALCMPGTYNKTLILPTNMPVDLYSNIKKENLKEITSWNDYHSELSSEEIKDFLTKMREKQKDLILSNLNELEDREKQNLNDMKKYGLIKYTELYEDFGDEQPAPAAEGEEQQAGDEDIEGESDFLALPTDKDDVDDEYI